MIKWHSEKRKISELKPAEYNPRQATKKDVADLTKSLTKFNVADPLVINKNNRVIGGHFRLRILKEKGIEEVDVRVPDRQLTEAEEKELNLRLNRNLGEWDFDALVNFDEDLLKGVGFESDELDRIFHLDNDEGADNVPETRETSIQLGDMFQLGEHRLLCGDATKKEDVEKLMQGEKADMVFTDPFYLVDFQGSVHKDGARSFNSGHESIKNDALKDGEGLEFLAGVTAMVKKYVDGAFYICFGCRKLYLLLDALVGEGMTYRSIIVWDKGNLTLSMMDYKSNFEPIVYGWNGEHKFYGEKGARDIWHIDRTKKNDLHPTMKPVALCEEAVRNSSQRNGVVLDLFGGSGSTLIACEKLNRKCRMMEIDPVYIDVIIRRWQDYTGQKATKI